MATASQQRCMVHESDRDALPEYTRDRTFHMLVALLMHQAEYRIDMAPQDFRRCPTNQHGCYRIDKRHETLRVRGNDGIRNAREGDIEPVPLLPQGFLSPLALDGISNGPHQPVPVNVPFDQVVL